MLTFPVNKGSIATYSVTMRDPSGVAIPLSSIASVELWLYDVVTKRVINSRGTLRGAGQDILNTNNVTVDANGLLTWALQAADNPVLNDNLDTEIHLATLRVIWGSPAKPATHKFGISVDNLRAVR